MARAGILATRRMGIEVTPSRAACGATVTNLNLCLPLAPAAVDAIRAAWLRHHVLVFPDQPMSDNDLERFARYFGPFGDDPYIAPIPGRQHIVAIKRDADERSPLFASGWHTDWSFQQTPPAGTCLFGITIPPSGGDTLFANQHQALDEMPTEFRARIEGLTAIHSAEYAYAPEGMFGENDRAGGRGMDIISSEDARTKQLHPIIRDHPETGCPALYSTRGYIQGFVGMQKAKSDALLLELYAYQGREQFVYRHTWQPDMLVMWDNRSLLHCATGGFEGHDRLLHRVTIGERV